ncbi:hypothetical protein ACUNEV_21550 [Serratia sp. IR-2025]
MVEEQVHRKAVPERLAIDGRQRKFNPLLPGSVNCLLQPEPGCFPADIKQGAPAAGPECGQEPAQQIDVAGIEQRYYPGDLFIRRWPAPAPTTLFQRAQTNTGALGRYFVCIWSDGDTRIPLAAF